MQWPPVFWAYFGAFPSFMPDERHKSNVGQVFAPEFMLGNTRDADQFLNLWIASNRNDQSAADLELLLQGFGNFGAAGGDDDAVIGRMIRPALCPIAVQDMHVVVAEISQQGSRLLGELTDPLDGVNVASHLRQDGGRIA